MRIKNLTDEDFLQYRKPSMFVSVCFCDWKCCKEMNCDVCLCQNNLAYNTEIVDYQDDKLVKRYIKNPITSAVVIGGFEPFLQAEEIISFVKALRKHTDDDIVIYTGYYENEIEDYIKRLKRYINIIVKFGRFRPNQKPHYDKVLGVELANYEQFAKKIS